MVYECKNCNKKFKRHANFIQHTFLCNIINDKADNNEIDLNDTNVLKIIINELIIKQYKMQNELNSLKRVIYGNQKNKINTNTIITLLQKHKTPKYDLNKWIENIKIDESDLNLCLNHGFINGMYKLLVKKINNFNFLYGFQTKQNRLYFYMKGEWKILDDNTFNQLITKIIKPRVMQCFNNKYDSNDTSYLYYLKNLSGNGNIKNDIIKIKRLLYQKIYIKVEDIIPDDKI